MAPLTIRMHERDNVAIVANDGGLPPGAPRRERSALGGDRRFDRFVVAVCLLGARKPQLRKLREG